jgi:3-methyladenine DNA glycosylase/8-oxoguanine DNA glycosylase
MYKLAKVIHFNIRPKMPYNFELTIKKPAGWRWFTPFEKWEDGVMRSGFWFRLNSGKKVPVGARAEMKKKEIAVDIFAPAAMTGKDAEKLKKRMINALGASEDIRPFYKLLKKDRILKHLVKRLYGMHDAWASDVFPSLTLAVLLQMAPIKRSEQMWDCVIKRYGARIKFDGAEIILWPTEEKIAGLRAKELKECKLGYRAKNLIKLAKQIAAGFPGLEELEGMTAETAKEKLTSLFGIGEYSAGFADPHPSFMLDVWSVKIFHRLIFGKPASKKDPRSAIEKTNQAAEKLWGPWRGYVLTYVLNDLPYLEKRFGITAD